MRKPPGYRLNTKPLGIRALIIGLALIIGACSSEESTTDSVDSADSVEQPGSPIVDIQSAKAAWPGFLQTLGNDVIDGGVGVSFNEVMGASGNQQTGVVTVWRWADGSFVEDSSVPIEDPWSTGFNMISSIAFTDLTADGHDDLFVYFALNRFHSKSFALVNGAWSPILFDGIEMIDGGELSGSTIKGLERICVPSCAEGFEIYLDYSWDGSQMVGRGTDVDGNKFTLTRAEECKVFVEQQYEPFKICNKGKSIQFLQRILSDYGLLYSDNGNPADGYFGPDTEYAVKVYQYMSNVPVTGIVEGQWYREMVETYNINNGYGG